MPPLPTITCKECGHVNETERVYCHNCGNKLDRSELLTQQVKPEESLAKKQRRIKKMMNPNTGAKGELWKMAVKTLFFAAVAAAAIDAVLPPNPVPPMLKEIADVSDLGQTLEYLTAAPARRSVSLSEDAINGYLWNTIHVKADGSWMQSIFTFQRVFVELEPDILKITTQNAIQNYPLYAGVDYRLQIAGNELFATPVGANIGRLQLPPALAPYLPALLDSLNSPWNSLKQERSLMNKLESVKIQKGLMILVSRGPSIPNSSRAALNARPAASPGALNTGPNSLGTPSPLGTPPPLGTSGPLSMKAIKSH